MKTFGCLFNLLMLAALIAGVVLALHSVGFELFEDGSFTSAVVEGCLPWAVCALP